MKAEVVLWALGGVVALACLIFLVIFIKFAAKATVSYLKHRPYPALAVFASAGGVASFIAAFIGAAFPVALLIGVGAGAAVLLLVAIELGAD